MSGEDQDRYGDMIGLPRHVSEKYPQMPIARRAAQFSPFAALKGYDEGIEEAKRITEERRELDEESISALNERLVILKSRLGERPRVRITYFEADARKAGGAYRTLEGRLKKIDEYGGMLIIEQGERVRFRDVAAIEII